jgi:hypothetical protein
MSKAIEAAQLAFYAYEWGTEIIRIRLPNPEIDARLSAAISAYERVKAEAPSFEERATKVLAERDLALLAAARRQERERAAKIADDYAQDGDVAAAEIAAAIREDKQ